mmetsp:Transcript_5276/g.8906  ORF Transcript_5276/g.8906 Transcript_5276/m.8906 type:complete len:130 (-) Transcript_5276:196-585(-)
MSAATTFKIQGPMGKGLGLRKNSTGNHIAFAAGTGVLVYVDIVARMILGDLNLIPDEEKLSDDFKFTFFASFMSREESIALDLMEGLIEIQQMLGKSSFTLNLRLSKSDSGVKPPRWTEDYLLKQLQSF